MILCNHFFSEVKIIYWKWRHILLKAEFQSTQSSLASSGVLFSSGIISLGGRTLLPELLFPENGRLMASNKLWRGTHCLRYNLHFRTIYRNEPAKIIATRTISLVAHISPSSRWFFYIFTVRDSLWQRSTKQPACFSRLVKSRVIFVLNMWNINKTIQTLEMIKPVVTTIWTLVNSRTFYHINV